jgi:hypothetical protein
LLAGFIVDLGLTTARYGVRCRTECLLGIMDQKNSTRARAEIVTCLAFGRCPPSARRKPSLNPLFAFSVLMRPKQARAGSSSAILIDELDAGSFQSAANGVGRRH